MTGDFEEAERDYRDMRAADPSTDADAKAGLAKIRKREQVSARRFMVRPRHQHLILDAVFWSGLLINV